jgi:transcriptional regulator
MKDDDKLDVPQGTLDLMILTILAREPMHGYGISQRLAVLSRDNFRVNPGSLFPSLYRLEQDGKLKAEWRASENNRQAKYYRLTAAGRRQLEADRRRWERASLAIASVLEGA